MGSGKGQKEKQEEKGGVEAERERGKRESIGKRNTGKRVVEMQEEEGEVEAYIAKDL